MDEKPSHLIYGYSTFKEEAIKYMRSRIKELEQELKESVPVHGMPNLIMHQCEVRISSLEREIKILEQGETKHENKHFSSKENRKTKHRY